MSETGRGIVKVTAWVAGGAMVGAALGLLYAPQSGADTRRQIRHYARRAQVKAIRYGRTMKDGLDHAVEYGKSWVEKVEKNNRRPVAA